MYAKFSAFPVPKFETPRAGDDANQQSVTKQLDISSNKTQMMAKKGGDSAGPRNFLIVPKLTRPKSVLIPSRKEVRMFFRLVLSHLAPYLFRIDPLSPRFSSCFLFLFAAIGLGAAGACEDRH